MKNLSILFIAILFLQLNTAAQEGWFQQASSTNAQLNSLYFINQDTGWIAGSGNGESGIILFTTNGGEEWNEQKTGTSVGLYSVFFLNEFVGYCVGEGGTILKTTNGGIEWKPQSSGTNYFLYSVYFTNANIGYAVGNWGTIIKTTDGGEQWDSLYSGTYEELSSVFYKDENIGYVVGGSDNRSIILRSTNRGIEWETILNGSDHLYSILFIDENVGFSVGSGNTCLKTTDGGEYWDAQSINPTKWGGFLSVYFTDQYNGYTVGSPGQIYKTSNMGVDWEAQSSGTEAALFSVWFTDSLTGYIVGGFGTILKTLNGGVSFVEQEEIDEIPIDYSLSDNYPEPFNPSTTIVYGLRERTIVELKVFDILGREVIVLINEEKPAGYYEIKFDASQLPSGIYFYRLQAVPIGRQASFYIETKKMMLVK